MDVTVCIGTYGDFDFWNQLAHRRAWASVPPEVPVAYVHERTLAVARNEAASYAKTEWLCFLDADDELERGYFEAMEQATADLRAPAVRYVPWGSRPNAPVPGRAAKVPRVVSHNHDCAVECLDYGNWLVIGTLVRRELFEQVQGFREWAVYEDYDFFARCWKAGATAEAVPSAVYRAHVRANSRNRGSLSAQEKHQVHRAIAADVGLVVPA